MLYFYGGHSTINASLLTVTMGRLYHCRRMQTVDASFNRVLLKSLTTISCWKFCCRKFIFNTLISCLDFLVYIENSLKPLSYAYKTKCKHINQPLVYITQCCKIQISFGPLNIRSFLTFIASRLSVVISHHYIIRIIW